MLLALLFLVPFYFVLVNSVKSFGDLMRNAAGWPEAFRWDNYSKVWEIMRFPRAFMNSLLITVLSNAGLVRHQRDGRVPDSAASDRFNRVLFVLFIAAMVIPFQSIMIPLVKVASEVGLMDSRFGLIICYFGFGVSLNLFLYHGFMKSIPLEIEEVGGRGRLHAVRGVLEDRLSAAQADDDHDADPEQPVDLERLPAAARSSCIAPDIRTIPLQTYSFFGQYTKQWDLALAGLVLGVAPMVAFFLLMQKHIIAGISAGAVKGLETTSSTFLFNKVGYVPEVVVFTMGLHPSKINHQGGQRYMKKRSLRVAGVRTDSLPRRGRVRRQREAARTREATPVRRTEQTAADRARK